MARPDMRDAVIAFQKAAGDLISTLAGHNGPVTAVTFDDDGQRIAAASQDGTAKIWLARASLEPRVLSGRNDAVLSLAYSPNFPITQ